MSDAAGLAGLFASAFVSSTLLPGASEAVLLLLAREAAHSAVVLLAVATAGNTLGGMTSWVIGRILPAGRLERPRVRRAVERVRRYGSPVLLLSWLPVVGDPLCLAAGWLRCPWPVALGYIAAGKAARYGAILWLAEQSV